ncbi:MAG: hypothetical protein P8Y27_19490, partial [Chromatiaceae bacterium]
MSVLQRDLPELTAILDGYTAPAILLGLDYRILTANRAYRSTYGDGQPVREPTRPTNKVSPVNRRSCQR